MELEAKKIAACAVSALIANILIEICWVWERKTGDHTKPEIFLCVSSVIVFVITFSICGLL